VLKLRVLSIRNMTSSVFREYCLPGNHVTSCVIGLDERPSHKCCCFILQPFGRTLHFLSLTFVTKIIGLRSSGVLMRRRLTAVYRRFGTSYISEYIQIKSSFFVYMYKYINRGTQILPKSRRHHKTVSATAQNLAAWNVCTHVSGLRDERYRQPDGYGCPCNC